MKFVGEIKALCPLTKKIKNYIEAIEIPCTEIDEANTWCQTNYKGYINIVGFFVEEIPIEDITMKQIEYYISSKCQCIKTQDFGGICINCGKNI